MDETTAARIAAARKEVDRSGIDGEHKDALQAMLDHAERCSNGTPDKLAAIGEAMGDLIVRDVRREAREDRRISAALKAHERACRKQAPRNLREIAGRIAAEYPLLVGFALLWAANRFGIEKVLALVGM